MTEENHEKTTVRLVSTGIWTQDLPNASLVRYHGATSLGQWSFSQELYTDIVGLGNWHFYGLFVNSLTER